MRLNEIFVILVFCLCGVVMVSAIVSQVSIHTVGKIRTIGIDCDTTYIDWGILSPSGHADRVVNLKVSGNVPVFVGFNVSNFQPLEATQYLALTWNYSGQQIAFEWVAVTFSLSVSQDVRNITDFSFDITIYAT